MSIIYKKTTLNNRNMLPNSEIKKKRSEKFLKGSIKKSILIFLSFISLSINSFGQILTFDFAGIVGNEITSNSNSNNPNISSSTISRGAGLTAAGNADRFNATNWALTSIATAISSNNYMQFTITPNAGCDYSISSIVIQIQRSATGPSQIALRSSADAYFANLGSIGVITDNTSTQTFTFNFVQSNINVATTYRFYMFAEGTAGSGGIGDGVGNDIIVNGSTGGCSTNTITTGSITGGPFGVTCTTLAAGSIAFTSSGTFTAGNNYTAQLSNAIGTFASPTIVGSLTSASNSGSISISIPAGTATGTGYLIRIISSTPAIFSNSSAAFSISLTGSPCSLVPPYVTSLLYDGCNVSCGTSSEGMTEILFGNTNDFSLAVNAANITLNYTTGTSYNMTSTIVNNTATTTALNTAAGCPGLFVDAFGTTLPTNASFLLVSNALCVSALVWNNLCGTGPIYVIYAGNGSIGNTWRDAGNFGNTAGTKSFSTTFITTDASVNSLSYSYTAPASGADGNYATWGLSGGSASTQGNFPGCSITPIVLPTSLISFQGTYINSKSELSWQTASEQNNSHFTLSHSTDGYQFNVIGTVAGSGNSTEIRDYRFMHNYPHPGMNYYKLKSTDYDGKEYSKGIVAIEAEFNFSFYNSLTSTIELSYASDIELYTTDGKLIQNEMNISSIPFTKSGLFFIHDKKTGISERLFIP
jgi:hypothetical protein